MRVIFFSILLIAIILWFIPGVYDRIGNFVIKGVTRVATPSDIKKKSKGDKE